MTDTSTEYTDGVLDTDSTEDTDVETTDEGVNEKPAKAEKKEDRKSVV